MSRLDEFQHFREHMNEKILAEGNLETRRFFGLDSKVYEDGRLDRRTNTNSPQTLSCRPLS